MKAPFNYDYRVQDFRDIWIHPIYRASFEERLWDLRKAIEMAESALSHPELLREDHKNEEGLKDGEFAIGNWIVRPRFK